MQIDLGGGFIVREFRSEDVPSLVRHANNEKVARNLEDRFPHPYGATDAEEWLEHVADQDPETYWGRGIATRAVRSITVWAFASFPLERIQARVFATNPASCRVLEKSGYTSEGRLRHSVLKINVLMDQVVYAILRHELPTQ